MSILTSKEALELAILEYEKDLETDENNQWVKNVLKGLKKSQQDLNRLEEYRKIEKEFSIDLITLFKAVMNGFWYKNKYGYHQADDYEYVIDLESSRLVKLYEEDGRIFCFEDYGKDWALTKKELEQ